MVSWFCVTIVPWFFIDLDEIHDTMFFMANDSLSAMKDAMWQLQKSRKWEATHTPKNVSMDLVREASEAMEHCIWPENEAILANEKIRHDIALELADVLHATLLLSEILHIDLAGSFWEKLEELKVRYPEPKE